MKNVLEQMEYFQRNIVYSKFTKTKLYSKYPVYDLIEKGLVEEIDNIIIETEHSKKRRGL